MHLGSKLYLQVRSGVAEASDVLPVAATTAPLMQYVRASLMDSRVNAGHL